MSDSIIFSFHMTKPTQSTISDYKNWKLIVSNPGNFLQLHSIWSYQKHSKLMCVCISDNLWTASMKLPSVYGLLYRCCASWICMRTSMRSCWQFRLWKVKRPWRRSLLEVTILQQLRHTLPHQAEAYRLAIHFELAQKTGRSSCQTMTTKLSWCRFC